MKNAPKLNTDELIKKMDEKGIRYDIDGIDVTKDFIENHNNYYRTAAYRKNFHKHSDGKEAGKYINLDFAYLRELSTIDMHLRFMIIKMCLDIEHALKVSLIKDISANSEEDGYDICKHFLKLYPRILTDIYYKRNSTYVGDLITKNFEFVVDKNHVINTEETKIYCPIWAFLEILSFGDFSKLYSMYYETYPNGKNLSNVINSVKSLRNACAHNNCIINNLKRSGTTKPSPVISRFIKTIPSITKSERKANLSSRPLLEFTSLMYLYSKVVSHEVKKHRMQELFDLFDDRMSRHDDYFCDNEIIKSAYRFSKKIVDFFYESAYNN